MPIAYKHWFLERLQKELASGENVTQDTAKGPSTPQRNINLKHLQNMFSQNK